MTQSVDARPMQKTQSTSNKAMERKNPCVVDLWWCLLKKHLNCLMYVVELTYLLKTVFCRTIDWFHFKNKYKDTETIKIGYTKFCYLRPKWMKLSIKRNTYVFVSLSREFSAAGGGKKNNCVNDVKIVIIMLTIFFSRLFPVLYKNQLNQTI